MQSRLYWHIHKLAFILEKRADELLKKELDIGFAQYKVLEAIYINSLAKQNAIAKMLDQTEASISRQIKILQKKGLINVTDVMGNRRAREIGLTHIGEEMVTQADTILQYAQAEVLGSLNPQEHSTMAGILEKALTEYKKSDN